jgi:hypothetical protein
LALTPKIQAVEVSALCKKDSVNRFKFAVFGDHSNDKFRSGKVTADKKKLTPPKTLKNQAAMTNQNSREKDVERGVRFPSKDSSDSGL